MSTAATNGTQELTGRQRAVLELILQHLRELGYPPTVRELCGLMGISSPNGMMGHLLALRRKGFIECDTHTARGIRLRGAHLMLAFDDSPQGQLCQQIMGGAA